MGRGALVVAVSILALSWTCGGPVLAQDVSGCPPGAVQASPGELVQELRLEDGSRLFGRVVEVEDSGVVFRTVSGASVAVSCGEIAGLRPVRGEVREGDFRPEDPNRTRLFFAPTARSLPRGRGYVGVYELLMPFVQVGVTDRITLGGGTPLVFGGGGDSHPFWVTPKVQLIRAERVQVAAGVMHIAFTGDDEPLGIAYGVVTGGSSEASLTAGVGYGYTAGHQGTWIAMVGGDKRVGRGVKLLAEGYVFPGEEANALVMAGVRLFGKRLSADLGLVTAVGGDDAFAFPMVNVVWTF